MFSRVAAESMFLPPRACGCASGGSAWRKLPDRVGGCSRLQGRRHDQGDQHGLADRSDDLLRAGVENVTFVDQGNLESMVGENIKKNVLLSVVEGFFYVIIN